MKKYDTIFFDLGGVLFNLELKKSVGMLARHFGVDPEKSEHTFPLEEYFDFERGRMDEKEFFIHWSQGLGGTEADLPVFHQAWDALIGDPLPTVNLLEKLLPHYQVWLLSNTNDYHISRLEPRFSFFEQVHGRIYSYRENCRKPEPEIFKLALERAGTVAERAIFIDDMEVNVAASREVGITTIQFTSAEELAVELKLLGLRGLD